MRSADKRNCDVLRHEIDTLRGLLQGQPFPPPSAELKQVGGEHKSVTDALRAYRNKRWFATTRLQLNSRILGFLETQSGPGALFRDAFFFTTGKLGIAKKVFLDAATLKA